MTTSLQRVIVILFIMKLLIIPIALTINGGNDIQHFEDQYYTGMLEGAKENTKDFRNNILESDIDPEKEFQSERIGSSRVGIRKTVAGNLLMTGLSNWIPLKIANDNFERLFLIVLNIFSIIITILAGYELFQIIWTKKNS